MDLGLQVTLNSSPPALGVDVGESGRGWRCGSSVRTIAWPCNVKVYSGIRKRLLA